MDDFECISFSSELVECYITESISAIICRMVMIHTYRFYFKNISLPTTFSEFLKTKEQLRSSVFGSVFSPDVLDLVDSGLMDERTRLLMNSFISSLSSSLSEIQSPLTNLQELSQIYQRILTDSSRKYLGEFYTSPKIVSIILQSAKTVQQNLEGRVIDLSCGGGAFLVDVIREKILNDAVPHDFGSIQKHLDSVIGIDINPLACLLSKSNLLLNITDIVEESICQIKIKLTPRIYCGDSLLIYAQFQSSMETSEKLDSFIELQSSPKAFKISLMGESLTFALERKDSNIIPDSDQIHSDLLQNKEKDSLIRNLEKMSISDLDDDNSIEYILRIAAEIICTNLLFHEKFDLVVGNPPYKRVQKIFPLWKRHVYKKHYSAASGHFDLYSLFMELGLSILGEKGVLSYILSNKFMTTTSGVGIRKIISAKTCVQLIIDFGDTPVFDAMVLPCIIVLEKTKVRCNNQFLWVTMNKSTASYHREYDYQNFLDLLTNPSTGNFLVRLNHTSGQILVISIRKTLSPQPAISEKSWFFIDSTSETLINRINNKTNTRLMNITKKIFVGIKTTANYAFMDELTESFLKTVGIEDRVLHPVLRGKNVRAWKIQWSGNIEGQETYILYPHTRKRNGVVAIDAEEIPGAIKYLEQYRQRLESRDYVSKAGREWYEIWNPKDPDTMMSHLKIITPDISNRNNFALDQSQSFIDGSCYIIVLKENTLENNLFILGQLNSAILEFMHKTTGGTRIYAGRYRYWSTNLRQLPIIYLDIESSILKKQVEDLTKPIINSKNLAINRPILDETGIIIGNIKLAIEDTILREGVFITLMAERIIGLVRGILESDNFQKLERELDWEVGKLFQLEDHEIESIIQWVDIDRSGG